MLEQLKAHKASLGWAFLLAWVFCVFYSGCMDGLSNVVKEQASDFFAEMLFSILPVSFTVIALVAVVALEKRVGPPAQNKAVVIASPIATSFGTLLMFMPVFGDTAATLSFVLAAMLTGFGSGVMWILWGQFYARLSQSAVETCAPVSAVLAALLSLVAMLVPDAFSDALVMLFPLVSGAIFALSWKTAANSILDDHASQPAAPLPLSKAAQSMGRGGFGILAACLFVSIVGSFWEEGVGDSIQVVVIFMLSAVFMLIVSVSATSGPRRVSLAYAYRWMCPLIVAGFAALIVFGADTGGYIAAIVGIASRFAFCLITQMYFASYAARGAATPVQAYGMGWVFVHLGDLLGVVIATPLASGVANGTASLSDTSAVMMVLLVAAAMFALNDGSRFLAWELPGQAPAHTTANGGVGGIVAAAQDSSAAEQAKAVDTSTEANASEQITDPMAVRIAELAATHKLTKRETEVFGLLAHGRSIPYVRDALIISRDTAATHAKHIYAKLGVHSRQELISMVEDGME